MIKKLLLIIAIFFTTYTFTHAQKYGTCRTAADVSAETFGPVTPDGAIDKDVQKHHSHGLYFEEEHNITWITFEVPRDTILTFDIVPQKQEDDLDFLLFRDTEDFSNIFYKKIEEHKLKPIRTNLAKTDSVTHSGATGLSLTATDSIVPPGYNPCYSKALPVKKGERFYLVVDNYTEAKGEFILHLHLKFPVKKPLQTEVRKMNIDAAPYKAPRIIRGKTNLTIKVVDSAGNLIKGQLDIVGIRKGTVTNVDTTEYEVELNPHQTLEINCNAPGYMFYSNTFQAPDTTSTITLPIVMAKVEEHKSFVLKEIKFQEGVAIFTASSQNELMNLLEFMQNNPTVSILIKGFVNDPGSDNSGAAKKLSKERAEAVYDFLAGAGIDRKRMGYKGFGNEHMIYPKPKTPQQEEANRRVEVEVMK